MVKLDETQTHNASANPEDIPLSVDALYDVYMANEKLIRIKDTRARKLVTQALALCSEIIRHIKRLELDSAKVKNRK